VDLPGNDLAVEEATAGFDLRVEHNFFLLGDMAASRTESKTFLIDQLIELKLHDTAGPGLF
jgi:hypothetical protein